MFVPIRKRCLLAGTFVISWHMQVCLKSWCEVTGNAGCLLESFQNGRKWDDYNDYKSASQCGDSSYKTHATTRSFLNTLHYEKVLYELFVITLWITLHILRQRIRFFLNKLPGVRSMKRSQQPGKLQILMEIQTTHPGNVKMQAV